MSGPINLQRSRAILNAAQVELMRLAAQLA